MGITLTGKTINSTYDSLLKLLDNDSLTGAFKVITDGLGNDTGISVNNNGDVIISNTLAVNTKISTPLLQLTGGIGTQGQMAWNADEETVDLINNGAVLQLGQEIHIHVRNNSATVAIPNGTPVYVAGTLGASGRLKVAPMIADGSIPSEYFLGVTTEEIEADGDGKVTWFGKVRDFDTLGFGEGVKLYVSETVAGGWQTTHPTAPNPKLEVAFTVNAKTNGTIFVRSNNGFVLDDLHDVEVSTPANQDLLVYNSTSQRWENSKTIGDLTAANLTATSFIKSGGTSSQFLKADGSVDSTSYQDTTEKGQALGYAPLDSGGKVAEAYLPDSVLGQVEYQGTWNASTNTPTLPDPATVKGHFYIVSVAGNYLTIDYAVGDWVISNGVDWSKVDNTDAVTTFNGRIGSIVPLSADYDSFFYTKTLLDGGQLDNRYYTETELNNGQLDNRYYTETELNAGQLDTRYYTETEVGNFFGGTTAITGYNKSNWDNAFGWGNHAGLYLPISGGTVTGDVSIRNTIYSEYDSSNTDITALIGGSTFGTYIKGRSAGHIVIGLRDNDNEDSFAILSGSGNYTTDSIFDKVVARFKADGTTILGGNLIVTDDINIDNGVLKMNGTIVINNDESFSFNAGGSISGNTTFISGGLSVTTGAASFSSVNTFNGSATFNDDITLNHSATGQLVDGITITNVDTADTGVLSVEAGDKLTWNGNALITTITAGQYVKDTGDTMTGSLTIENTAPLYKLKDNNSTGANASYGQIQWYDQLDTEIATVGFYGLDSNFYIDAYGSDVVIGDNLNVLGTITGNGSGLTSVNATTLDSIDSSQFLRSDVADESTAMKTFYSSMSSQDDWQNSPISIRERGAAGAGDGEDRDSPNLNFHWSARVSNSLWMDTQGRLNWGSYSSLGIPAADGTIKAATFIGALTGTASNANLLDSLDSSQFLRSDTSDAMNGTLTLTENLYMSKASDPRIYAGTNVGLNIDGQGLYLNRYVSSNIIIGLGGGNAGIGTASPERKLHVFGGESGGAASNANSTLVLENSTHTYLQFLTPATVESGILFGDTDNDAGAFTYNHSTNSFSFRTNAVSNRFVIDGSGNIGIGLTPENSAGTWRNFQIGGGNIVSRFSNANDFVLGTGFYFNTANGELYKNTEAVSRLFFNNDIISFQNAPSGTAGTGITWAERMQVNANGQLLIGDSVSPSSVWKGTAVFGKNGTDKVIIGYLDASPNENIVGGHNSALTAWADLSIAGTNLIFRYNGTTEGMRLNSSGNLGVGASSGFNSISGTETTVYIRNSNVASLYLESTATNGHKWTMYSASNGNLSWYDVDVASTRMTIDASGKVGIQATAPVVPLHIGNGTNQQQWITNQSVAGWYSGIKLARGTGNWSSTGNNNFGFVVTDNGLEFNKFTTLNDATRTTIGLFTSAGDFHADGNIIGYSTTISDIRFKDEVKTIENALELTKRMRGAYWTWNAGSKKGTQSFGHIAQEVENITPDIVKEIEMPLMDSSGKLYKTIESEQIIGIHTEAIKQLAEEKDREIAELKARISKLEQL